MTNQDNQMKPQPEKESNTTSQHGLDDQDLDYKRLGELLRPPYRDMDSKELLHMEIQRERERLYGK